LDLSFGCLLRLVKGCIDETTNVVTHDETMVMASIKHEPFVARMSVGPRT
jgi:hypothetical protein